MRKLIVIAATILLSSLAGQASAQAFNSTFGPPAAPAASSPTSTTSTFFGQAMAKPAYSTMMTRPPMPGPLNLTSMLPTFPNLQNMMMLRNVFGQQTSVTLPRQATPPPK